jgi:hypothetical protein
MTEEEWLKSEDPIPMLQYLGPKEAPAYERLVRLFACGCCRRVWDLLHDDRSKHAIEVAERFAEKLAGREQLEAARSAAEAAAEASALAAERAIHDALATPPAARVAEGGAWLARAVTAAARAAEASARTRVEAMAGPSANAAAAAAEFDPKRRTSYRYEEAVQCRLLRCIFGNPFRPPPVLDPGVLAWHGGAARRLAQAIYESRRFGDLPVLADLLEEAGVTDAALLGHLRGPGPHALGCWALDVVLVKA